jgi:hypothetical protein
MYVLYIQRNSFGKDLTCIPIIVVAIGTYIRGIDVISFLITLLPHIPIDYYLYLNSSSLPCGCLSVPVSYPLFVPCFEPRRYHKLRLLILSVYFLDL